ncbi:MAG: cyclase family protein [Candidatus Dormibacteraceae bacterium]
MTLIDLSQPFSDGMFSLKLFPRVRVERCVRIEESGLNVTCVEFAVHSGTHLDSPRHFFADGRTIDEIPLEDVSGAAVGLQVRRGPGEAITVADLEADQPTVEEGDLVFISTGWARYFYGDRERYAIHPYLSVPAAEWLVGRGARMVAMDIPTPDQPEAVRSGGFDWPVHHVLLSRSVLVAEHLANLEAVANRRFRAYAFPLPIRGADGSPARIVAEL